MVEGSSATVVSIVLPVLATSFVAARLVARCKILQNPGWEDGIIVLSLFFAITTSVFVCLQVKHGLGSHFDTLNSSQIQDVLKFLWASIPFYNLSLTFTKISVVLQYIRVFVGKKMRIVFQTTMCFIISYGIGSLIGAIFSCVPVAAFWDLTVPGRCLDKKFTWFFNASLNLVTDLIIVGLPMPVLKKLDLPKKQKIGLMCIFGLGGFVCLVSVLRLHSLYIISVSTDPTFDNTSAAIWSVIEINVAIICGSLATLRPLISRLFPALLFSQATSLPTHNHDIWGIDEAHKMWQPDGHSRVQSNSFNASRIGNNHFVDLPKIHPVMKQMVLRNGELVPPVPEKDDWIRAERTGPRQDIIVTNAARRDVEVSVTQGASRV